MRRKLFSALVLLSLILSATAWVTSYFRYASISYSTSRYYVQLASGHGDFRFVHKSRPSTATAIPAHSPALRLDSSTPPETFRQLWPESAINWQQGLRVETGSQEEYSSLWDWQLWGFAGEDFRSHIDIPWLLVVRSGVTYESLELSPPPHLLNLTEPVFHIQFPIFWPTAFFAFITACLLYTHIRRRRNQRRGLCPTCAYNLTAHVPGQKCPECGTSILPSVVAENSQPESPR